MIMWEGFWISEFEYTERAGLFFSMEKTVYVFLQDIITAVKAFYFHILNDPCIIPNKSY